MASQFLDAIDWQQPWLDLLRPLASTVVQATDWRTALNDAAASMDLRNHAGCPVHFVPQSDLPSGTSYEAFIHATGGVPTRDNLHDFFNALVWLSFPRIKARLNALQAAEIERSGAVPHRGKLRDGATIFDENAAMFVTSDEALLNALRNHQWSDAFLAQRSAFNGNACDVYLFGHAIMEKLVAPYKAIAAHAWAVMVDDSFFAMTPCGKQAWLDSTVAAQLGNGVVTSDFTPLPVLGVPGWCEGQDNAFYGDVSVFRPKRI